MPDLDLIILNKNYSSWSMRPWVLLTHLGVPFRETIIYGHEEGAEERLRAASPTSRVPVLRHGTRTIWESIAIAEYLAELHPNASLWPEDPGARAEARSLSAEMHAGFTEIRRNCTMNVVLRTKRPIDPATQRDVTRLDAIFRETRARYASEGPYLMGAFGIVDAMFAPIATRFRSYGIEASPEAQAYLDTLLAHPAVARFCEEAEREADTVPAYVEPGRALACGSREHQPDLPCWAVIFPNQLRPDADAYGAVADRMLASAREMPGFIDYVSTRNAEGFGITVSYWSSLEAIAAWRAHKGHAEAQRLGRERFYDAYELRVARVEKRSSFVRTPDPT
jgi:glutathione S-transferase